MKRQLRVSRLLDLDHERHSSLGTAKRERLACVVAGDGIHVLEVAIRTPLDHGATKLSFFGRFDDLPPGSLPLLSTAPNLHFGALTTNGTNVGAPHYFRECHSRQRFWPQRAIEADTSPSGLCAKDCTKNGHYILHSGCPKLGNEPRDDGRGTPKSRSCVDFASLRLVLRSLLS